MKLAFFLVSMLIHDVGFIKLPNAFGGVGRLNLNLKIKVVDFTKG